MSLSTRVHLTPCRVSMQSSELNYMVQLACILWEMPLCKQRPNSGPKFSPFYQVVSMCVSVIIFQCPGDKSLLFKQTARLFLVHICVSYRTATFLQLPSNHYSYFKFRLSSSNWLSSIAIHLCLSVNLFSFHRTTISVLWWHFFVDLFVCFITLPWIVQSKWKMEKMNMLILKII